MMRPASIPTECRYQTGETKHVRRRLSRGLFHFFQFNWPVRCSCQRSTKPRSFLSCRKIAPGGRCGDPLREEELFQN